MASSNQSRASPASSSYQGQHRSRPISRRTASSYDAHPFESAILHRHHRAASSSALPITRTRIIPRATLPATPPLPAAGDPRFSRLFSTVLGSPFLTTSEPRPHLELQSIDVDMHLQGGRPASPASTADFSIIDMDTEDSDSNPFIPGSYPSSRFLSSPINLPRGRFIHTGSHTAASTSYRDFQHSPPHTSNSLKSLLPRLWDALSTPGRSILNLSNVNSTSLPTSSSSSRTPSPSASPRRRVNQSWYTPNVPMSDKHSPVYKNTGSANKGKGKSKAGSLFHGRNGSRGDLSEHINYSELPPLDGEEGELIDDEACFIDVKDVQRMDILALLPPEIALHILALLCPFPIPTSSQSSRAPSDIPLSPGRNDSIINEPCGDPHVALCTLLSCRLVSRAWRSLASDNAVWRALFLGRWGVDLRRASDLGALPQGSRNVRATLGSTWDCALLNIGAKAKRILGLTSPVIDIPIAVAPLRLDWRIMYRERLELDRRWLGATRVPLFRDLNPVGDSTRRMGGLYNSTYTGPVSGNVRDVEMTNGGIGQAYEPTLMTIAGHTDSVYCIEFDSRRIITGSRDRTIKVWSLRTGKLLGSFAGAHRGSVLCLKFERDWDRDWKGPDSIAEEPAHNIITDGTALAEEVMTPPAYMRTGFMVSGSSDCSVRVWDLHLGEVVDRDGESTHTEDDRSVRYRDDGDREVKAEVRAVLKGHVGGVLDLRIDGQWIVSCSKDAVIRVWNRKTLELHRTLRGHEGPVNAVGLQTGKLVSASGDGKMILWDIDSGERLRTFEGHDRGLACIEFKEGLIVSGSSDCNIKLWSASTGECLRTLVGHGSLVRALSFDPRSGRLVSASYDKSVKLWDLGSGKLVREFKGTHTSNIFDVKFDVSRIISTSHDQKIVVLDFSADLNASLFV